MVGGRLSRRGIADEIRHRSAPAAGPRDHVSTPTIRREGRRSRSSLETGRPGTTFGFRRVAFEILCGRKCPRGPTIAAKAYAVP